MAQRSSSRTYRRWAALVVKEEIVEAEAVAVLAILLVEMSARTASMRAIEWIAAAVLRAGLLGRWGKERAARMTLGPLQMRAAPFMMDAALREAQRRVSRVEPLDAPSLAAAWNGPRADSANRPVPYTEALETALPIARATRASAQLPRSRSTVPT